MTHYLILLFFLCVLGVLCGQKLFPVYMQDQEAAMFNILRGFILSITIRC